MPMGTIGEVMQKPGMAVARSCPSSYDAASPD